MLWPMNGPVVLPNSCNSNNAGCVKRTLLTKLTILQEFTHSREHCRETALMNAERVGAHIWPSHQKAVKWYQHTIVCHFPICTKTQRTDYWMSVTLTVYADIDVTLTQRGMRVMFSHVKACSWILLSVRRAHSSKRQSFLLLHSVR